MKTIESLRISNPAHIKEEKGQYTYTINGNWQPFNSKNIEEDQPNE